MLSGASAEIGLQPHWRVTEENAGSVGESVQGVDCASPVQAPVQLRAGSPPMKEAGSTTIPLTETRLEQDTLNS